jgi:putative ABC transport system permease protein
MIFNPKISLAWLQLIHKKGRFAIAIAGIAFAVILILMQVGFQDALYESNTRIHQLMNADVILLSPTSRNLNNLTLFSRSRLFQAASHPSVISADSLYIEQMLWINPDTNLKTGILVIGFNPAQQAFNLQEINENLDLLKVPDTYFFDQATRGNYQKTIAKIKNGQPVFTELSNRKITLKKVYTIGASFGPDGSIVTSDQNFLRVSSKTEAGEISIGRLLLKPGSSPKRVATELSTQLPKDVMVLTKQDFVEFEKNYWHRNTAIGFIFAFGTCLGFIVGIIIVYQILYSDVTDHLPEYATLKALGYKNTYFLGVVFQEALFLAILGYIPGSFISIGLYALTRNATNLPLCMTFERAIQVFIITIMMCVTSSLIAMKKLGAADPADIF